MEFIMSNKNLVFMIVVILVGFTVMMFMQNEVDYTAADSFESASSFFDSILRTTNIDSDTQ
tara:strand:- start:609 stop:791 length:183 start_codon:yes stop_codon:yes gene_type:complete